METCTNCGREVAYEARFCPGCGQPDPGKVSGGGDGGLSDWILDHLPWNIDVVTGVIGALAGSCVGGYFGFSFGGIGGLIVFGAVGGALGYTIGAIAPILFAAAVPIVLSIAAIALVIWILISLWGVGK